MQYPGEIRVTVVRETRAARRLTRRDGRRRCRPPATRGRCRTRRLPLSLHCLRRAPRARGGRAARRRRAGSRYSPSPITTPRPASRKLPPPPRRCGVALVPGVELACDLPGNELHMLGLFIDPGVPALQARLRHMREARDRTRAANHRGAGGRGRAGRVGARRRRSPERRRSVGHTSLARSSRPVTSRLDRRRVRALPRARSRRIRRARATRAGRGDRARARRRRPRPSSPIRRSPKATRRSPTRARRGRALGARELLPRLRPGTGRARCARSPSGWTRPHRRLGLSRVRPRGRACSRAISRCPRGGPLTGARGRRRRRAAAYRSPPKGPTA